MTLLKKLSAACLACFLGIEAAHALSLDDLYRDIIRSDNRGYLPLFVKNRKTPDFLLEIEGYEMPKKSPSATTLPAVNLSNDFRQRLDTEKFKEEQWLKTVEAVKKNQVTPLELTEITKRANDSDPQATEILAWMYAKGIGVSPDFIEAFHLYKKAARLNVANAEKNAMILYHAMNKEQRELVKTTLKPL